MQVRIVSGLQDKKLEDAINNGAVHCAKIGIGEGIAGTVFLERKPIITNLGSADPRFIVKEVLSNTKSLLCVPLIAKGEAIGVINITNKKNNKLFNKQDLRTDHEPLHDFRADHVLNISAGKGEGLSRVTELLEEILRENKVYVERVIPYAKAGDIQLIRKSGELLEEEYVPEGIAIKAYVPMDVYGKLF